LGGLASGLAGAAGGALGKLNSLTAGLQSGKSGLASLASAGLPAGAAAALAASMNSLSTSSPFPIKMPSIATGTSDRSELVSLGAKLLGNPIIPPPDYAAEYVAAEQRLAEAQARSATVKKLIADLNAGQAKSDEKKKKWHELRDTLPAGDPAITAAYQEYSDAWDAKDALRNELIAA
jgi:hypothetical protein